MEAESGPFLLMKDSKGSSGFIRLPLSAIVGVLGAFFAP